MHIIILDNSEKNKSKKLEFGPKIFIFLTFMLILFQILNISNMIIWGNHSSTQYPDFYNSLIKDTPTINIIDDMKWLQNDFERQVELILGIN